MTARTPRRSRAATLVGALLAIPLLGACATNDLPPLEATAERIDLERFMGDWYVHGFIPIDLPFFSEAGAHNAIESYELMDDGRIETTYTFRDGAFDGPERQFTPTGWVHDQATQAEWRMQFLWPFKAAYLILHVDADYQETIVGVPDRGNLWILSRSAKLEGADYQRLLQMAARLGYDTEQVRRVPQQWPGD